MLGRPPTEQHHHSGPGGHRPILPPACGLRPYAKLGRCASRPPVWRPPSTGHLLGPDVAVEGVATDSRSLGAGQLFVPLTDQRDGHAFLAEAVAAGAPAYLTNGPTVPGATAIAVADTGAALAAIGRAARARLVDRVVGVTGSVGKTTVKDLVAGVLATTFRTSASPMSYNNEIGVPLTLANAADDAEAVVVEMGARGSGHIRLLCRIAEPSIGVVTRVGQAHTEHFGSIEGVAAAKAELVESLPATGAAVLNADDPRVRAMRDRARGRVLLYGLSTPGVLDVTARRVVLDRAGPTDLPAGDAGGVGRRPPGPPRTTPGGQRAGRRRGGTGRRGAAGRGGRGAVGRGRTAVADERPVPRSGGGPGQRQLQRQPHVGAGRPGGAGRHRRVPAHRRPGGDGRARGGLRPGPSRGGRRWPPRSAWR